jgi:hypothetical protein
MGRLPIASACRMLTSLHACAIPPCDITIPLHGGRDARRDGDDVDLPGTVGTIAEASHEGDCDDARVYLDRNRYSSEIEEVCIDEHDDYVEAVSTLPCIPAFPSHLAFCCQGIEGRRFFSEQIPKLSRARPPAEPSVPVMAKAEAVARAAALPMLSRMLVGLHQRLRQGQACGAPPMRPR